MGLQDFLAIFRTRKLIIALTVAVTVVAAGYYSSRLPPLYTSSAQVLVQSTISAPDGGEGLINLDTEKELATSASVAEFAADELEEAGELEEKVDPSDLLEGLSVDVTPNTEILVFNYTHRTAKVAQMRAGAFARGYLAFRRQQILDELVAIGASIGQQIEDVQAQLETVNQQLAQTEDESTRAVLQAEANALASRLGLLQQEQIPPPEDLRVGQIVQTAALPESPSINPMRRNLLLALIVGLALGVGFALLAEILDDRLRGRHDLETHTTAPVLTVIPRVGGWRKQNEPYLATLHEPNSPTSESYKTLRTGLLFAASQRTIKIVMITSPEEGEGKTTTTANLGVVLARAGKRVILVSADLRRPRLQSFFDGSNSRYGLTNILAGEKTVAESLVNVKDLPNLRVLGSGAIPGNPAELLTSFAMGKTLKELARMADIVLIDAPPVLPVSDALGLSRFADGVLFVADGSRTRRSAVEQATERLGQVGARLLGSVLNNFDPKKARTYIAHNTYYYAKGSPGE